MKIRCLYDHGFKSIGAFRSFTEVILNVLKSSQNIMIRYIEFTDSVPSCIFGELENIF